MEVRSVSAVMLGVEEAHKSPQSLLVGLVRGAGQWLESGRALSEDEQEIPRRQHRRRCR